jgi:hypothetical protein
MRRTDLEHVIRAASAISDEREFLILGTASLLEPSPLRPTRQDGVTLRLLLWVLPVVSP